MAQVPECVVCLQPYDDYLHVPRVLACGHSFCELCLIQLQSAWQPSSSSSASSINDSPAASARGAMIRCPECSHRTRLPLGGQQSLPKNVELLRLLPSLVREADSSNTEERAGSENLDEFSSGFKEPLEGKGIDNNPTASVTGRRVGDRLAAAAGGVSVGNRNRGNIRRPPEAAGKGIQRPDFSPDSSSTPTTINASYLLPFDLYSENSQDSDVRGWILPEKVIKLRRGEENPSFRSGGGDRATLRGEMILEQERLSSSVPVSLRQLTEVSCAPHSQEDGETPTTSYEDSVLKAWEGCHYEVQTELLILFRVSVLSRGVCTVLGVWMNHQRSALFLVTQARGQDETVSSWEMVKKSFQQNKASLQQNKNSVQQNEKSFQQNGKSPQRNGKSPIEEEGETCDQASDAKADDPVGVSPPEKLSEVALPAQQEVSSLGVVQQLRFSRVGLELCGALREVHSQGVVFGLLSPNCFVLDVLGSLVIDLNAALGERSSLQDATTRLSSSSSKGASEAGGCRNCCWRYMSPEALSLLTPSSENQTTVGNGNDASSSSSFSSDKLQHRLTGQTDVWSLGCLLLELVSGKAPFEGLTFQQVLQKILVDREKPGSFYNFLFDPSTDHGGGAHGSMKDLSILLTKCFEFHPDHRARLDVLHRNFMELGWGSSSNTSVCSEEQRPQSEAAAGGVDQKYWVLSLGGFNRDGSLESRHGRGADVEESQRQISRLLRENGAAAGGARELPPCGLEQKGTLEGHLDYVTALVVCGDYLLSASFDKTIRVWSLERNLALNVRLPVPGQARRLQIAPAINLDYKLRQTLQGHSHMIAALAVDHNTLRCFSGDNGGKICAWKIGGDSAEEPLIATWQEHDDWRYTGVGSLAVSADGILYSGSGDRTVKAWSVENFNPLGVMEGHKALVSSLLVDGELLYSGSWDGTIHVWWRSDQSIVAVLGGSTAPNPFLGGVRTLYMSDSFLFAGRDNGAIQVWRDEECLTTVKAHEMVVSALYVEGDFLYTGSWDQKIKAWKVDEFLSDPSPTLVRDCGSALSALVSDGDQLYAGVAEKGIKVYSLLGDTWASLVQMLY